MSVTEDCTVERLRKIRWSSRERVPFLAFTEPRYCLENPMPRTLPLLCLILPALLLHANLRQLDRLEEELSSSQASAGCPSPIIARRLSPWRMAAS